MRCRWCLLVVPLCCLQLLRADTVVLKNGEHKEGQVLSETADEIVLRTRFKNSKITYEEKIRRADVSRVERGPVEEPDPDLEAPATEPAEAESPSAKIPDKPAFLDGAIQKYRRPDYNAAGMDLTRLIRLSNPGELQQLSAQVEKELDMPLAEFAALAHFKGALARGRGGAIQINHVTDYELPHLIPMLTAAYERAIEEPVMAYMDEEDAAEAPQAASRPAGATPENNRRETRTPREGNREPRTRRTARDREHRDGRDDRDEARDRDDRGLDLPASRPSMNIATWLDRPRDFNGDRFECEAITLRIQYAASLITERLQFDPEVRKTPALKARLGQERAALAALLKSVKARSRGALTPREREIIAARQHNLRDAAERARLREQRGLLDSLQRHIEEQQQLPPQDPDPDRD